jgi:hypothetical protein
MSAFILQVFKLQQHIHAAPGHGLNIPCLPSLSSMLKPSLADDGQFFQQQIQDAFMSVAVTLIINQ